MEKVKVTGTVKAKNQKTEIVDVPQGVYNFKLSGTVILSNDEGESYTLFLSQYQNEIGSGNIEYLPFGE